MDLKGIIAVSGMGGLFKIIAQAKNGFIVESLADKKRQPIPSSYRVSSLSDISVYTTGEDLPLADVLKKMKEAESAVPSVDPKSDPEILRGYFKKVLPDYDEERVYPSDIKKIISWYGLLKGVISFEDAPAEEPKETGDTAVKLPSRESQPVKAPVAEKRVKASQGARVQKANMPQKRGGG